MRLRWNQLGGQAGIGLAIAGFLLIFLGWNGAATYDREPAQLPYLISGGIAGLALVVLAAAMIVVNAQRADRAALLNSLAELKEAMDRTSLAAASGRTNGTSTAMIPPVSEEGMVIAGPTTYHRPSCKLLEGRGVLPAVPVDTAQARHGVSPRSCDAADYALPVAERDTTSQVPRRRRRAGRAS